MRRRALRAGWPAGPGTPVGQQVFLQLVDLVGGSLEICANSPNGTLVRATLQCALPKSQPVADELVV